MKRGKLSEDFVDSDSDLDTGASSQEKSTKVKASDKPAKAVKTDKTESSSEEFSFELSGKRRVTVRKYRSSVLIDIREFYEDKTSGEMRPGSKGIALSKEQYSALKELLPEIDKAIKKIE